MEVEAAAPALATRLLPPRPSASCRYGTAYTTLLLLMTASLALIAVTLANVLRTSSAATTTSAFATPSAGPPMVGVAPRVLIVYHSVSGGTRRLANLTAGGARACCNASVLVVDVTTLDVSDQSATATLVSTADAIILGSGVYNGGMHPRLAAWLVSWPNLKAGSEVELDLQWTVGDAICTSGGYSSGAQPTLWAMQRALQTFNAVYAGGTSWRSGSGACAIIEGDAGAAGIGAEDAAEAQKLGYRAAMLASVLRSGGRELRRRHLDPFDASDAERVRPAWPS